MSARKWKTAEQRDLTRRFNRAIKADPLLKTMFEIMFDQENRLRALESRPPVTRAQARAFLKIKYTGV